MAEELPPDSTAGLLQPSPELTPENLSGKLTPHPPDGKPSGRPHQLRTGGSKDSIPEELPTSQEEARHSPPPPEVDEKIEGDLNEPNKAALDGLVEKARALASVRAKEKLPVPPEELEHEEARTEDVSKESVTASARDRPEATSARDAGPAASPHEDEELNTAGKLPPHPPEGEPSKRPNPRLKQALHGSAAAAEDRRREAHASPVQPAAKESPPVERERSAPSSKKTKQRSGSRQPQAQEQKSRPAKTRQDDNLPKIIDNRLPKLVDEIEEHLKQMADKPPVDGSGWLAEIGQLELFAEELRWLLNQREDSKANNTISGNARGRTPKNARSNSNSDDLQRALQHLRSAEIEHARLQQRLHVHDPRIHQERMAELQQVETNLLHEKRRLHQLNQESHLRDLKLARAAKRARLGELGSIDQGTGSLRVLKQTEWLQAEVEVWQVKNGLLEKQIQQQEERRAKAQQGFENLVAKRKALEDKLESDTVQNWMAQKQNQEDQLKNEAKRLRSEVQELQERRRKNAQAVKQTLRSRTRRLGELRSQQASLETELIMLKNTELRLLKTLKQQDLRAAERAKSQREAEEAAMLALQEAEEAAAQALAAHDTMRPDAPVESQTGELRQVESNVFDLTVMGDTLDVDYDEASSAAHQLRKNAPADEADDEAMRLHVRELLREAASDGTLFGALSEGELAVGAQPSRSPPASEPRIAVELGRGAQVKEVTRNVLLRAAQDGELEKALRAVFDEEEQSRELAAMKIQAIDHDNVAGAQAFEATAETPERSKEAVMAQMWDVLQRAAEDGELEKALQSVFGEVQDR